MFILGTYVGIVSTLFSAFVCWRCFTWRRRFPSANFLLPGVLSGAALLWSGFATLTETAMVADETSLRSMEGVKAPGEVSPKAKPDEVHMRIVAGRNSIILTNVGISFVVTVVAGLLATATFRRVTSNEGDDAKDQPTSA